MADGELIWKFLDKNYKDDHPTVYIYCVGQSRSSNTSTSRIFNDVEQIFCPPMDRHLLKKIITAYLDNKKKLHKNGKIKVRSIY